MKWKRPEDGEMQSRLNAMRDLVLTVHYPDELYERLLFHLKAALDAHGAAIWRLDAASGWAPCAEVGASDEQGSTSWDAHRDLVAAAVRKNPTGEALLLPAGSEKGPGARLLIQQVHPSCPLVIEIVQRADLPSEAMHSSQAFLQQTATLLAKSTCIPRGTP